MLESQLLVKYKNLELLIERCWIEWATHGSWMGFVVAVSIAVGSFLSQQNEHWPRAIGRTYIPKVLTFDTMRR